MTIYISSLKPENVVIDEQGYIKLTDFGLAQEEINEDNQATDFCGTPEYLAPDFFNEEGYGKEVDWWSLGVLMYEMICGFPPFQEKTREKLFSSIRNPNIYYPKDISDISIEFFKRIFEVNPKKRIGSNGAEEIKNHPLFSNIIWEDIYNKKVKPPFMPRISRPDETRYIHSEFLEEHPSDSIRTCDSLQSVDDKFKGNSFDYVKSGIYISK
jgi:serine/threonine protein kinase